MLLRRLFCSALGLHPRPLMPSAFLSRVAYRDCGATKAQGAFPEGYGADDAEEAGCLDLLRASTLWLLRDAMIGHDAPEKYAVARKELLLLVSQELLPAAQTLGVPGSDCEPEEIVRRIWNDDTADNGGGGRDLWNMTNGLLLTVGYQPRHMWLVAAAGHADLLGAAVVEERDDMVGGVFAATPGADLGKKWLKHSVVIVFEASVHGVGALVVNHPTPLRVGDLGKSNRFASFAANPLYAGGAFGGDGDTEARLAPSEMSPWYWLHSFDSLETAERLSSTSFLGGDVGRLSELIEGSSFSPDVVRFFWRHTAFEPCEFEAQIRSKMWRQLPDDAWQLFH